MEQVGFFNHLTWGEDIFLLVIEYATGIFTETVAKGVCFKTNKQATLHPPDPEVSAFLLYARHTTEYLNGGKDVNIRCASEPIEKAFLIYSFTQA